MWLVLALLVAKASAGGQSDSQVAPKIADAQFSEAQESFASVDGWNAASFAPLWFRSEAGTGLIESYGAPGAAPAAAFAASPAAAFASSPAPVDNLQNAPALAPAYQAAAHAPPAFAPATAAPYAQVTAPAYAPATAPAYSPAPVPAPAYAPAVAEAFAPVASQFPHAATAAAPALAASPAASPASAPASVMQPVEPKGPTQLELSLIESSKVVLEKRIQRLEALAKQAQKEAVEYISSEAIVLSHDRLVELDAINLNRDFRLQQVAKQLETERSASAFAGAKAAAAAAAAVKERAFAENAGLINKASQLATEADQILDQDRQLVAFMDAKLEETKLQAHQWPTASVQKALNTSNDVEQSQQPMAEQASRTAELATVLEDLATKVLAIIDEANTRATNAAALSLRAVEIAAQNQLKMQMIGQMAQQTYTMVQATADNILAKP